MADKYAHEGVKTLHTYGFHTRTDPTVAPGVPGAHAQYNNVNQNTGVERGRADVIAVARGLGVAIEFKTGGTSFAFQQWRDEQREWAWKYCQAPPFNIPYFLWIWIGTDRPHSKSPNRRRSWLIPALEYIKIERLIAPIQQSIPLFNKPGQSRILQENGYCAIDLWSDYEMLWAGNGSWAFNSHHVFRTSFIDVQPLFVLPEGGVAECPYKLLKSA